jgi:hypothetical protein
MTMIGDVSAAESAGRYQPPGWDPSKAARVARRRLTCGADMVRTPTFWALWIAYCLGTTAGTMVISQLVPFARAAARRRSPRSR